MTGCGSTTEPRPRRFHVLRARRWGFCYPSDPKCNLRAGFYALQKCEVSWKLVLGRLPVASLASTSSVQPHGCC